MPTIRPAVAAGRFYPADPGELELAVRQYIGDATASVTLPNAIIVPHAGYPYSGPIAGTGYAQIAPLRDEIERVILLGPAHHVRVRGLAASSADAFETPLGRIPLDRAAIESIATLPQVVFNDDAHAPEHSLEVQLPFLQVALDDIRLVPLLVGTVTPDEIAEVLERLWGGMETLIVISSDLSHFHDHATATRLDGQTADAIVEFRIDDLRGDRACGYLPISGLLSIAQRRGLHPAVLDVRNSGDTAGSKDRVVGYGAFAFSAVETDNG